MSVEKPTLFYGHPVVAQKQFNILAAWSAAQRPAP